MLVEMETSQSVRILWMNGGPENRFNPGFIHALNEALDQAESERAARSVVFASRGEKCFCNGLDLQWLAEHRGEGVEELTRLYLALIHRVFTFPKPVVCAINGHAFAGGLFLALAADYRVMRTDRGWCCIPEIDLGFPIPPGHLALLQYVAGKRGAEWFALSGVRLPAQQALEKGLIDEAVPLAEVLSCAKSAAARLGAKRQPDYAILKLALRREAARVLEDDAANYVVDLHKWGLGMKS